MKYEKVLFGLTVAVALFVSAQACCRCGCCPCCCRYRHDHFFRHHIREQLLDRLHPTEKTQAPKEVVDTVPRGKLTTESPQTEQPTYRREQQDYEIVNKRQDTTEIPQTYRREQQDYGVGSRGQHTTQGVVNSGQHTTEAQRNYRREQQDYGVVNRGKQ